MEYDSGSYLKLQIKQFPARSIRETAEGKYWKQFKAPVLAKQVRKQTCAVAVCNLNSSRMIRTQVVS